MRSLGLAALVLFIISQISGVSAARVWQLNVSSESVNISNFIQVKYNSSPSATDSFSISRLRFDIWGDPSPSYGYLLEIDPSISPSIVYGWVDLKANENFKFRAGKFYYPFGLEYTTSPAKFDTINPANFLWYYFGYSRDIGVQAIGSANKFRYYLSVVNGKDNSNIDDNNSKDFCGRITRDFGPFVLGGSYYSGISGSMEADRVRGGVELSFNGQGFKLKGEFASGLDDDVCSQGWYVTSIFGVDRRLELVLKLETWDPDISSRNDMVTTVTPGINYFFDDDLKLQVNYIFNQEEDIENQVKNDAAQVQLQLSL